MSPGTKENKFFPTDRKEFCLAISALHYMYIKRTITCWKRDWIKWIISTGCQITIPRVYVTAYAGLLKLSKQNVNLITKKWASYAHFGFVLCRFCSLFLQGRSGKDPHKCYSGHRFLEFPYLVQMPIVLERFIMKNFFPVDW